MKRADAVGETRPDPGTSPDQREYVIGALIAAVALGLAIPIHYFAWGVHNAIGFDDGYTIALAQRVIDGRWLPYVDGLSHRGPLLYWATAVSLVLTEPLSWTGPRALTIICFFVAATGCFTAGAAARRPIAGALAALFYVFAICVALHPYDALSLTGEKVSAPFCMASLTLAALGVVRARSTRSRVLTLGLAGVSSALAGLAKQTALVLVLPIALWSALAAFDRHGSSARQRWLEACAIPAGWTVACTLALLPYAVSGNLAAFRYWFFEYNARIYMEPYPASAIVPLTAIWWNGNRWAWLIAATLVVTLIARGLRRLVNARRQSVPWWSAPGFEFWTAASTLAGLVSSAAALRYWPHYFIAVLTYVGLTLGLSIDALLRTRSRARRLVALLVTAVTLVGVAAVGVLSRSTAMLLERQSGEWAAAEPEPICDFVRRHSTATDKIFIWGFDGDLYVTCKRRPATSFTYLTFVAGLVPPFWGERREKRVVPGAPERLAAELRAGLPPVILDAPQRLGGVSVRSVPVVNSVLQDLYCPGPTLEGREGRQVQAYVLRKQSSCPDNYANAHGT
ncbi:MAG TPA: hypothetical protein VI072_13225 [Polyangiaceae bacterium]